MNTTRVSRHILASRRRVYQTLLDPEAVREWMMPEGMTSPIHVFDATEGGTGGCARWTPRGSGYLG